MAKTLTKIESLSLKLKQREEELAWVHSMYRCTPDELDHARIRVENFVQVQVNHFRKAVEEEKKRWPNTPVPGEEKK
jgi:hypothetical protein